MEAFSPLPLFLSAEGRHHCRVANGQASAMWARAQHIATFSGLVLFVDILGYLGLRAMYFTTTQLRAGSSISAKRPGATTPTTCPI